MQTVKKADERIDYVVSGCSKLTQKEYKRTHDNLGKAKNKNTLVSGNAGDEKNPHPGDRKFIFLTNLFEFFK